MDEFNDYANQQEKLESIYSDIENKIYRNQETAIQAKAFGYIIVEESTSAHCCFEYTIIDTSEGVEDYGNYYKKVMCECFTKSEAIAIRDALNHYL